MNTHSTAEVATAVGVSKRTLMRWLKDGKARPTIVVPMNGRALRRWTDRDVERVRKYKEANYRKGRGRKRKVP